MVLHLEVLLPESWQYIGKHLNPFMQLKMNVFHKVGTCYDIMLCHLFTVEHSRFPLSY